MRRLSNLLALALCTLVACGDGTVGYENPGPGADGTDTGAPSGDGAGDGDGTVSALCDDVQLPARGGNDIVVSPAGDGMVTVQGGSSMSLRQVVSSAQTGDTIWLEDGIYLLPEAPPDGYTGLYFTTPGVTLRSVSGDAEAVIIDSAYRSLGDGTSSIVVAAPDVALGHFTVSRSIFHLIHFWADGDDGLVHDVRLVDGGQQFMKSSGSQGTIDKVEVSCSRFLMTDEGRDNVWGYGDPQGGTTCYTGGIDTHEATNWSVHDNYFRGIYCDATGVQRPAHGKFPDQRGNMTYQGGLSEHAIHMWDSEQGTGHILARNRIDNCARGIGIGLVAAVHGTEVVNNTIFSDFPGSGEHDVGIIVERAVDTLVAHNTVIYTHPRAYPNTVEFRWGETTNLEVHGNLTNGVIKDRNGALGGTTLADNTDSATTSWFVDGSAGDLRLSDCSVLPGISLHASVDDDMDGKLRADPTVPGADHCL